MTLIKKIPYALLLAPILIYWGYWTLNSSYWFPPDPGAWYFLDSLAVFAGKTYVYVDHPGTPVHLIGSLLLALTLPFFKSRESFIAYHIARPETFFFMANVFLLAINSLTAILFYQTVRDSLKKDKTLLALALSLMFFGLHPQSYESLTFWSHNSFNYPFGALWLIGLYRALRPNLPLDWKKLAFLGFTAGTLGMTQMYFLGWLAAGTLTTFIFSRRLGRTTRRASGDTAWFVGGGLLGIAAMLAPITHEIPRFASWFTRILSNTGVYGSGASGFYTLEMIPQSLAFWATSVPALMAYLLAGLTLLAAILLLQRKSAWKISPADQAMLTGLLAQIAMLLVVLSKLYLKLRYMLALTAVLPVLLFLLFKILESAPGNFGLLRRTLALLALIAAAAALPGALNIQAKKAFVQRDAALARSLVVTKLAQSRHVPETDIVVIYGSGTPIKCAGLLMANNWIRAFDREIARLCPNQFSIYDSAVEIELNILYPVPQLDEIAWDVVVSPGNHSGLQDTLRAAGAVNVPGAWGVNRAAWFFIRPEP
ncbi:hypothetical protein GW781_03705 [bacterium]|nr:hypothetical protein [bacterium]NCT20240.1 hypothetical protein [bacterium]